jgi:Reverse transcriptase (RNA-dependent DNA polymerase)
MIKQFLDSFNSKLLESADYQRGFKKGMSTKSNLAEIIGIVTEDVGKRKLGMRTILSVDLSKAYDKVRRNLLFEVLESRVKNPAELQMVALIDQMYHDQKMFVGDHNFDVNMGVAQGDILAPNLFAIYLDAAIQENEELASLAESGKLYAYADDIVVITESQEELTRAIQALESLEAKWNLCLNKKKSQIISKDPVYGEIKRHDDKREFLGIQVRLYLDLLGMRIFTTKTETLKATKKAAKKNV